MKSEDAQLFLKIADSLSLKAAAAQLGISHSKASKRIAALESELGALLINRAGRRLTITAQGRAVLDQCRVICDAFAQMKRCVDGQTGFIENALQVALPDTLAEWLVPILTKEVATAHPRITLDVNVSHGDTEIAHDDIDLALVLSRRLTDSGQKAQRLLAADRVLVASPGYLARHGTPKSIDDIVRHRCIGVRHPARKSETWHFGEEDQRIGVNVQYTMTSNSLWTLALAATFDSGLLYVPDLFVKQYIERGLLRIVLPTVARESGWALYAVYPHATPAPGVRSLVDFLKTRLRAEPPRLIANRA